MQRILRAFVWLRWRTLVNSLERRTSRDVLERFSIALEQLGPTLAVLLLVPTLAAVAAFAVYAGWALTHGDELNPSFIALRMLLLLVCFLAVVGPVMLPAGDRAATVRLLLLPIPRGVLYASRAAAALADPWIALACAATLGVPLGLALGGMPALAVVASVSGVLVVFALVGVALLVGALVQLIVRERRRGELLGVALVLLLPLASMLPALLAPADSEAKAARGGESPGRGAAIGRVIVAMIPSEQFLDGVAAASGGPLRVAVRPLATLAVTAAVLHLLAFAAFNAVVDSAGASARSRASARTARPGRRIPGLSAQTSAVAINQLRLAFRTPRGKATMLAPVAVMLMLTLLRSRGGGNADLPLGLTSGLGVAAFAAFVALVSVLPLAMNQFAIDRAGLTLMLLSPLDTRSILRGKAIGNGLLAVVSATLCVLTAAAIFREGHAALWVCIPVAALASYLLAAPAAAVLSTIFPRAVDMASVGGASNAHSLAGLLGMLAFAAALLPAAGTALAARAVAGPIAALVALVAWCAVAGAISIPLFAAAARLFERRRENLGLVARATTD